MICLLVGILLCLQPFLKLALIFWIGVKTLDGFEKRCGKVPAVYSRDEGIIEGHLVR